jgi:NAD(P)-dependent dehydrogenase (short-subunit alcohol dehydrogenase family)
MYLTNKKIVVTGAASGIGAESAKEIKRQGATVIGVDLNQPQKNIDHFVRADLSDPVSIESAVKSIPDGIDAICNIAGLPPTKNRAMVIKVNFLGLRHFTELMIDKLNNNASIVNMASLAGFEWNKSEGQIKALLNHFATK